MVISLKDWMRAVWIRKQAKLEYVLRSMKKAEMATGRSYMPERGRQMDKKAADWDRDNIRRPRARRMTIWSDEITKFGAKKQ